ncbi:MAG: co-chaperone GroES [endosymbiont of Seepiophila jonesi]|uniref:Co-chaperonin GroES n=1 Tax=endosymbiont of Lamellibrachia luymesi TaxID=2200907 RepID=A0A370DW32_9GAMM|nr:MAG: co-chaperone GroES [endosymbiont of Lamellibrachia luymesi]RDH94256.1 MAG: co-chaperone GroES [endosymbiont of Seepiophila jonesi]
MNIRPLHDRLIVRRMEEERTSPGGIVLPDSAAEKPMQGEVLAVGKGKVDKKGHANPLEVKVGDKVLFGKYSGTEVKIGGDEVLVMREEDIMGVIED